MAARLLRIEPCPHRRSRRPVRLWEVETGSCLRELEGHTVGVVNAAWNSDQRG